MKTCCACRKAKPRSEFLERKQSSDGLHARCNDCRAEYAAEYRRRPEVVERDRTRMATHDPNAIAPWACVTCSRQLKFGDYYASRSATYGRSKKCRECTLAQNAQYRKRKGTDFFRGAKMFKNFGITREQFDEMLAAQGNVCGGCQRADPGVAGRFWHIDHDHSCCPQAGRSCGRCVRGILCHGCNLILGHAEDSADRLTSLADYLARTANGVRS